MIRLRSTLQGNAHHISASGRTRQPPFVAADAGVLTFADLGLADAWGHDTRSDRERILRYVIGVAVGLVATLLLFLLMQALIKSDQNPFSALGQGGILEFVRLEDEKELITKPRRPKRPPPPDKMPPDIPKPHFDSDVTAGIEIGPKKVLPDDQGLIGTGFAADGEYLPIVKVKPVYPRRAQQRGTEGYVLLEFVVTTSGAVRDPVVIEAKPPGVFDRSAIQAALKFKYKPKVANGEPLEVSGVRNLIKFKLEGG